MADSRRRHKNLGCERMPPAEALRAAQVRALNNPGDVPRGADAPVEDDGATLLSPYYWAEFTLPGDWR